MSRQLGNEGSQSNFGRIKFKINKKYYYNINYFIYIKGNKKRFLLGLFLNLKI
jgi:hypothetical protein